MLIYRMDLTASPYIDKTYSTGGETHPLQAKEVLFSNLCLPADVAKSHSLTQAYLRDVAKRREGVIRCILMLLPGYSQSEDTHFRRLTSELVDLWSGYANRSALCADPMRSENSSSGQPQKRKKTLCKLCKEPIKSQSPEGVTFGVVWSCYPDSDRGPHPYQGCALPAEP